MAVIDHAPQAATLGIEKLPARKPGTPFGDFEIGDPAPGVDIVMAMPREAHGRLLDGRTLKLIGSLHRRFWDRRRHLLMDRARFGEAATEAGLHADSAPVEVSLRNEQAETWEGRVALLGVVADIADAAEEADTRPHVAVRGWEMTENAVLVDGRAVPGAIFDIAVAFSLGAEAFRREQDPFAIVIPVPVDDVEAQMWRDLSNLAHDRAGIDRGTVAIFTA